MTDPSAPLRALVIIGTRPEAIKMVPVVRALRASDAVDCRVCATAQHREMLDQVLELFGIVPDYDLDTMAHGQSPTQVAARILERLDPVLREMRPDWVLVQGDTTTVAVGALAAFYAGAKVGHVEAGLRSGDRRDPFPEEVNRRVAGAIADLHFAPTALSESNLLREGVDPASVLVTGNTVIDALHWASELGLDGENADALAGAELQRALARVEGGARMVLVTAHRRENHGAPLGRIASALRRLAERYGPDSDAPVEFVFPVHPNPNVRGPVHEALGGVANVTLIEPLPYRALIELMRRAAIVLTDSGGMQEEAPGFGKPVLVLRETTERPEGVDAGTARLIGTDEEAIVGAMRELLDRPAAYAAMAHAVNPYGDGRASERILAAILQAEGRPADGLAASPLRSAGAPVS